MKTKHTPGPWLASLNDPCAAIEGHLIKTDDKDEVHTPIALLWVGGGTHGVARQLANAKLIAAAPSLLRALSILLKACDSFADSNLPPLCKARVYEILPDLDKARAIIAKATE